MHPQLGNSTSQLPLASRAGGLVGSVIDSSTSLLQTQTHDIVRFAMGSPAPEAIPTVVLAELGAGVLAAPDAYDYGATEGDPPLRASLLGMLEQTTDRTAADRLTITAGGMQGLDLCCKLFIEPGDLVIVESPTYTNGSATALAYGAELLEAPMDADGLIVEALPELIAKAGRSPKAIYVIPTFQNPSGATMSLARREQLIELNREHGGILIDDDPYGMLRFEGGELPSLRALGDGDPLIFSVRTFSKIVAPGLRVGWVDAAPELAQLLINAKQTMDTCTNLPAQRLLAGFLDGGHLLPHLRQQRAEYRRRKLAMQDSLARHFADIATWTDPHGGFFLWVQLNNGVSTTELFEVALTEGVAFIPGTALSPTGRFDDSLRLCFASTSPERTEVGIERLRRAVDALAGQRRPSGS